MKIIAVIAIILGIAILIKPDLAGWLIGAGLIVLGIIALIRK